MCVFVDLGDCLLQCTLWQGLHCTAHYHHLPTVCRPLLAGATAVFFSCDAGGKCVTLHFAHGTGAWPKQ